MRRVVLLQHLLREGPGRIAEPCLSRGLELDVRRLDQGDAVPVTLGSGDLLIVMGGSMNVGDVDDPRYPFLAPELELLRRVLANGQPVLGVCLGAQLLAHAAGAEVYAMATKEGAPAREVGFGEVALLDRDREPVLAGLPASMTVLHWHGQTFDLPDGATHLAKSEVCAHQAFRIGRRAFGLQFHVEADADMVRRWAVADAEFVRGALGADGPAVLSAMADAAAGAARPMGDRLIGNILDHMLSHSP